MSGVDQLYSVEGITMPLPLDRHDWLLVKFWEKRDWEVWVKEQKEKGSFQTRVRGAGVNSSWMEDENGNRVSLARQGEILEEVRRTWLTMEAFGVSVQVYGSTDGYTLNYFRAKMESKFQEFRLCANHWKADRAWVENFSSWKTSPESVPQGNGNKQPQPQTQSTKVSGP